MKFALVVGILFLVYILIVLTATTRSVEAFGVFGCSPVPFDKVLKDMYTPKELTDYLNKNWNDKTPDEKNKAIADWDNTSCDNQNSLYTMFVEGRQKRDTVDKLAK